MVDIAYNYAKDHKIHFSTDPKPAKSKTKGMIFSKKPLNFVPAPITLSGHALPWVQEAKYLGGKLTNILDGFQQDVREKRAGYIERNCELIQEFPGAHPEIKCRLNRIYNSSFPGSILWDLTAPHTTQIINSWSVSVRHMWDLPMNTHRKYMESLGGTHAKIMLMSRYVNFIQSMQKSSRKAVLYLFQRCKDNLMTVTGRNLRFIKDEVPNCDPMTIKASDLKKTAKFCELERDDAWRVEFAKEIVNVKQHALELSPVDEEFTPEELNELIDYILTS